MTSIIVEMPRMAQDSHGLSKVRLRGPLANGGS